MQQSGLSSEGLVLLSRCKLHFSYWAWFPSLAPGVLLSTFHPVRTEGWGGLGREASPSAPACARLLEVTCDSVLLLSGGLPRHRPPRLGGG